MCIHVYALKTRCVSMYASSQMYVVQNDQAIFMSQNMIAVIKWVPCRRL